MRQMINFVKRLFVYIKKAKKSLYLGLLAIVVMQLVSASMPYIMGLAVTELGNNLVAIAKGVEGAAINFSYVGKVLVVYFSCAVVYGLSEYNAHRLMAIAVQDGMAELREDISNKINRLPVAYFDQHLTGDILNTVTTDVDTVSTALQQGIVVIIMNSLGILMTLIAMFVLNYKLALIMLVGMILALTVVRLVMHYSQPTFNKQANALGDLFGFTQEQLSGFIELTAYNQQDESIDTFKEKNERLFKLGRKTSFLSTILNPISSTIINLAYVIVIAFGGNLMFNNQLTIGNLQAFMSYVGQIRGPINQLTQQVSQVQSAQASAERIFSFLDSDEEVDEIEEKLLPEKIKGEVQFDHVQFGYSSERQLMSDVNFTAKAGQTVAIVGPTGAGKTTMINLLMRFYDVTGGAIKVDGVDIRDISRHELRSHIGMVLQDAWLYKGTVMENIRLGNLDASDDEVIEACKIANVHEFIQTLPGGYNMIIEENGSNVSQGQRQLMTIARAVLSDPDILILDEATSSVDTRLEKLIQDAMNKVMEGRTSFVIAHRLSTIKDADTILVMQDGDIKEQGNHRELLKKDSIYADLYNAQFDEPELAVDVHMTY